MSDLPTREEVVPFSKHIKSAYQEYNIRPSAADIAVPQVLDAYTNGTLMTRQEFIDSLDIEAAAVRLRARMGIGTDERHDMSADVKAIVAAAFGEDAP